MMVPTTTDMDELDRPFEVLLDEALAPEPNPDLTDRILARPFSLVTPRTVLAVVGPARMQAVAAAVLVAATIATAVMVSQVGSGRVDHGQIDRELAKLSTLEAVDELDIEIELLAIQIEQLYDEILQNQANVLELDVADFEIQLDSGFPPAF